jgi:hypothetical protein
MWPQHPEHPDVLRLGRLQADPSKQAELNARRDADQWVPEHPDAWKLADDKLMAARW